MDRADRRDPRAPGDRPPRRPRAVRPVGRRAAAGRHRQHRGDGHDVLVLDEPTAQLDPAGTASVADLLDELARSGTAILCAEHDPTVLGRMDRCLVLDAGRPVALDRPGRGARDGASERSGLAAADARPAGEPAAGSTPAARSTRRPSPRALAAWRASGGTRPDGWATGRGQRPGRRGVGRSAGDPARRAAGPGRGRGPRPSLPDGVEAVRGVSLADRARRGRRHPRPERLGQDDARQAPQRPAAPGRGPDPARRRSHRRPDRRPSSRRPSGSSSRTRTTSCSSGPSSARSRSVRGTWAAAPAEIARARRPTASTPSG